MTEYTSFVRKPFTVEAVQITEANIEELAPKIGTLKYKDEDNTPFIHVDPKLIPNIYRVYPGFWLTKMGGNSRCYANKIFVSQFVPLDDEAKYLVHLLNQGPGGNEEEVPPNSLGTIVRDAVSDDLIKAAGNLETVIFPEGVDSPVAIETAEEVPQPVFDPEMVQNADRALPEKRVKHPDNVRKYVQGSDLELPADFTQD